MNLLRRPTASCLNPLGNCIIIGLLFLALYSVLYRNSEIQDIVMKMKSNRKRVLSNETYKGVDQEDEALAVFIRKFVHSPSKLPYKLTNPELKHFSHEGQSKFLDDNYFHGMRNGFFLEVGGLNGEWYSNSLYFERELGWKGLLVEPNPNSYQELVGKQRKVYSINAALSPTKVAQELLYISKDIKGIQGRLTKETDNAVPVKAFPLYSILRALNVTFIDFFSFDIEGYEFEILKTLPWDKVSIGILCIEVIHIPEGKDALHAFLTRLGYVKIGAIKFDYLYGLPDYLKKLNQTKSN